MINSLSHNATMLALARMNHAPEETTAWSDAKASLLRWAAAYLLHRETDAAALLAPHAERLVEGIELTSILGENGPFGPSWPAHPFSSPAMKSSYKLREPDITRALAEYMGPAGGRRGPERAISFLTIIAELADRPAITNAIDSQIRPVVLAESPVDTPIPRPSANPSNPAEATSKRVRTPRIDLMFEWPIGIGDRRAVVVIEAKLGAIVGEGQLKPYGHKARSRAKGGPLALVLLTAHADKSTARYRSWAEVRWFALMRRWEHALAAAGDDDPEFARVRAHIWRFILSSGGVFS